MKPTRGDLFTTVAELIDILKAAPRDHLVFIDAPSIRTAEGEDVPGHYCSALFLAQAEMTERATGIMKTHAFLTHCLDLQQAGNNVELVKGPPTDGITLPPTDDGNDAALVDVLDE
jgi:hypothetical protein